MMIIIMKFLLLWVWAVDNNDDICVDDDACDDSNVCYNDDGDYHNNS